MKKIPLLAKKRRTLADLSPDSLAAALYHCELMERLLEDRLKKQTPESPQGKHKGSQA